jgi:tetratricopeptide (TPR) repeat protein
VKIIKRLMSWGESAARIWAAHWLLILGGGLVVGSVILKWVEYPFTSNLSGLTMPLLGDSRLIPHIVLFSFGALGVGALISGLVLRRFFASALSVAASLLITLWVLAPAHIAFQRPAMLQRLVDELQTMPLHRVFAEDYLPQNFGAAEEVPHALILYTVKGRLLAAISFLRLGWYCFGIGSLLVAIYAIYRLPNGRIFAATVLFCLPTGALAIALATPLVGQHYVSEASIAKARGHDQEAIANYRKAMEWDAWHAQDVNLYAIIGDLQRRSGIANGSPERHISNAIKLRLERDYDRAIFEFNQAAKQKGVLAKVARRECAKTRVSLGLALYQAGGVGGAVSSWQLALADDPMQVELLPYLARGYFDLGRYDAGLQTARQLAKVTAGHDSIVANAYSMAGDCNAKLGRVADARHYYTLSLVTDPIENYWALTGLIGE